MTMTSLTRVVMTVVTAVSLSLAAPVGAAETDDSEPIATGAGPGRTVISTSASPSGRDAVLGRSPQDLRDRAFLTGGTSDTGAEPWVTDGTAEGTKLLADVVPGVESSRTTVLAVWGDRLLVGKPRREFRTDLWVVDPDGTAVLLSSDVRQGPSWDRAALLVIDGDRIFFSGTDSTSDFDYEPWVSDGTPEGTRQVADIDPTRGSYPEAFSKIGDTVIFTANDQDHGRELWTTDGTEAGTRLVVDLDPGFEAGVDGRTQVLGDSLYFLADRGADGVRTGSELYVSDGTRQGTHIVKDITPGPDSSVTNDLVPLGNTLVFSGRGGLWASDGTTPGTVLISPQQGSLRFAEEYGPADDRRLMYPAETGWNGTRVVYSLFSTDGTAGGTVLVADVGPVDDLGTSLIETWGDKVLFRTDYSRTSAVIYYRLWVSDGTTAGTWPITGPEDNFNGLSVVQDRYAVYYGPYGRTSPDDRSSALWSLELNESTTAPTTWTPPPTPTPTPTPTAPSAGAPGVPPDPTSPAGPRPVTTVRTTGSFPDSKAVVTVAPVPAGVRAVRLSALGRLVASTPLRSGRAEFDLPSWVRPGSHRLTTSLVGTGGSVDTTHHVAGVAKARSTLRVSTVRRQTSRRGTILRVRVAAREARRSGTVTATYRGRVVERVRVGARGQATLRLERLPSRARITVSWSGNSEAAAAKKSVRVRRR